MTIEEIAQLIVAAEGYLKQTTQGYKNHTASWYAATSTNWYKGISRLEQAVTELRRIKPVTSSWSVSLSGTAQVGSTLKGTVTVS